MDYFRISQDKRYLHAPVIMNVRDIVLKREFVSKEFEKRIADVNIAFASPEKTTDFVDILDSQLFLVCDRVKEVFKMYEPAMIFKMVCILANLTGEYGNYYMPIFQKLDCLSNQSIITPDKSQVKRLILKSDKVKSQSMFQVAGLMTDVTVIRLDVLESLLRRKIIEFHYTQVEMEAE